MDYLKKISTDEIRLIGRKIMNITKTEDFHCRFRVQGTVCACIFCLQIYCVYMSIITLSLRLKIVIFLTFSLIQSVHVVIVALVCECVWEPLNVMCNAGNLIRSPSPVMKLQ